MQRQFKRGSWKLNRSQVCMSCCRDSIRPRPTCSLFLSFLLVQCLWTLYCMLFILQKPERFMGLGLSVVDKLFRSLGFHQRELETYKSVIYDSYPWAPPSQT